MSDYVEQGDVRQLIVQRKDGSTWTAEIDIEGKVKLIKKLSDPNYDYDSSDGSDDSGGSDDIDQQEQQEQQQADQQQSEAEQQEQQEQQAQQPTPEDEWGEEEEMMSEAEADEFIESLSHRGGNAKTASGKPPEKKMPKWLHEKLKDSAFQSRLRSVMLDNKFTRRVRGRTRGKLDMGRLYKVPTHSRSVFMQKQERRGKEYNVVLCIDQSGSMVGDKIKLATEIALFLTKQFENMNINIGIIGYSDDTYVYKELGNKRPNYDELYSGIHNTIGGTNDYPALRRAYHMLRNAQGKKILLMLSDGSPGNYDDCDFYGEDGKKQRIRQLPNLNTGNWVSYVDYNERDHLHHLVNSHKDVTSIGIGIKAGGWQIPEHFVVHDLNDLKSSVLGVLRKHITRG